MFHVSSIPRQLRSEGRSFLVKSAYVWTLQIQIMNLIGKIFSNLTFSCSFVPQKAQRESSCEQLEWGWCDTSQVETAVRLENLIAQHSLCLPDSGIICKIPPTHKQCSLWNICTEAAVPCKPRSFRVAYSGCWHQLCRNAETTGTLLAWGNECCSCSGRKNLEKKTHLKYIIAVY